MCVAVFESTRGLWVRYAGGVLCLLVLLVGAPSSAVAQRFLSDDPLWHDPDRMDMPFPEPTPSDRGIGPLEFFERSFGVPGDYAVPAKNVNTVGGVPNSSWYTNRHYRSPMSRAALRRGPNQEPGPSSRTPWRVVNLLTSGELPRAVIRDTTGRTFQILFDAPAHPEMATGAAMISSRLLHALGYNVPQHWLRRVRAGRLVPEPDSGVTQSRVDSLLASAAQRRDSTYRALVTRIPDVARRIGPFQFKGTRADDGNDVFPHEDRRELRGLRVVAAWIHHSKLRPRHTLDVGVRVEGRRFVRHYLTDLHLTLGSAGATPKSEWSGHEHVLELGRIFERIGTLGLSGGDWAEVEPPDDPALGRFGTHHPRRCVLGREEDPEFLPRGPACHRLHGQLLVGGGGRLHGPHPPRPTGCHRAGVFELGRGPGSICGPVRTAHLRGPARRLRTSARHPPAHGHVAGLRQPRGRGEPRFDSHDLKPGGGAASRLLPVLPSRLPGDAPSGNHPCLCAPDRAGAGVAGGAIASPGGWGRAHGPLHGGEAVIGPTKRRSGRKKTLNGRES